MEAHPVPQNVTNFEFHLVGDMTVKQFGYLAIGGGLSYIIFLAFAQSAPFIAYPLIVLLSLSGIAFAFLPISERPLDHWVFAFFHSIFSPTQMSWSSKKFKLTDPQFKNRLQLALSNLNPASIVSPPAARLSSMSQMAPKAVPLVNTPSSPVILGTSEARTPESNQDSGQARMTNITSQKLPTSEELEKTVELAKKATQIQTKIVIAENELENIKRSAAAPGADPKEFTNQFQTIMSNLQTLTCEASEVSREIATTSAGSAQITPKVMIPTIKRSAPVNLVLTSTPNIINGIVTDTLNNYLEGVIVVTHDRQGLPVRALKTNKLGQFVAATPLPNGTYTLSLEKDNLNFGNIEVTLDGKVLAPIAITAQKGGM